MVHGDDSGLVLPPRIAPTQTMIIPIAQHKEGVLDNMYILCQNLLNIEHGVLGGKWDRKVYKKLVDDGVIISGDIKIQSMQDILFNRMAIIANRLLPNKVRLMIKKSMKKMGKDFKTEL